MSIVAILAQIVEPAAPADPMETIGPGGLLCIGIWLAAAVMAAASAGVFDLRKIVGPSRYGPGESAWQLLLILALSLGVSIVGAGLVGLGEEGPSRLLASAAVQGVLTVVAVVVAHVVIRRNGLKRLGLTTEPARGAGWGFAAWLLILPAVYAAGILVQFVLDRFDLPPPAPHPILEQLTDLTDPQTVAFMVALAVVLAPLSEEMLFRGLLQTIFVRMFRRLLRPEQVPPLDPAPVGVSEGPSPSLPSGEGGFPADASAGARGEGETEVPSDVEAGEALPPQPYVVPYSAPMPEEPPGPAARAEAAARWLAVVAASVLFALVHIEPAFLLPLFVLSLALGYVYERTGNLWAPIALHALFNGSQIAMVLLVGPDALQ